MLWDQARQRVDDRAIADLLVVHGSVKVPLVRIDLADSLHEELRPEFKDVLGPGEDRHRPGVARNLIVDLNQALLSHESELDPVLSG